VKKKALITQESLKSKLDQLESDHDSSIRKLNEEKLELKKQQKGAQKKIKKLLMIHQKEKLVKKQLKKLQKNFQLI